MREGDSSCMVSRALPSSYDRESMRVYAGDQEDDEAEEEHHHPINGVRSAKKKKTKKKKKKKTTTMAADSYGGAGAGAEHDDRDSLISPVLGRDLSITCLLHLSCSDYGAVASLNRSFRSLLQSGELYRLRRRSGAAEHWVFFSCNVLEWDAFDPLRRRWIAAAVPRMPPLDCFMFCDKESLAVGPDLLVFGKDMTSCIVLRYSLLTNSWSRGVAMRSPRCLFGSASSGGATAIVAGGIDTSGKIVNSAEMYDSDRQCWDLLPGMHRARKMCSSVFMDGRFYVIGGMRSHAEHLACGEEYDLERRAWRLIPGMAAGLTGGAATGAPPLVAVVGDELYAADYASNELRRYDKLRNAWATLGRLPERSVSMNGWGLAFKACGDRLIVIGGRAGASAGAGGVIELNSWVPTSGGPPEWEVIASRQSGSFVYNCAVMVC